MDSELKTTHSASRAENMLSMFEKKDGSATSRTRKLSKAKSALRTSKFNNKSNNKLKTIGHKRSNRFKGGKNPTDYSLKSCSGLTTDTVFTEGTDDTSFLLDEREIKVEVKPIVSNDPSPEIDVETIFTDVWNPKNIEEESTKCDIKKNPIKSSIKKHTKKEVVAIKKEDVAKKESFDEDIAGGYSSPLCSEDDEETFFTLDGTLDEDLDDPADRLIESFTSMFKCSGKKSNPDPDLSFKEKALRTAEAVKLVYSEGSIAVRELFDELKEDLSDYRYARYKDEESTSQSVDRQHKKQQHTRKQQKKGIV
mmetsp:Transcript_30484/g.34743  ORF Transcript_30484/g.34743 Transcript_30484/m.34743 type:complete len:309 (+) Transcript_30484:121-1047(+)